MNKASLRSKLKAIRASLDPRRREEAKEALLLHLLSHLTDAKNVLSFASFNNEIDTSLINLYLARTNRLLLPKIEGESFKIFQVANPQNDLVVNSFGLNEPSPQLCAEVDKNNIQIVLVPALGFDMTNHRIGYGRGFYDRFLKQMPHVTTIGIGFKEQFIEHISTDEGDVALEKVSLF